MVFVWVLVIFITIKSSPFDIIDYDYDIVSFIIIINLNLILKYALEFSFWRLEKGPPCPFEGGVWAIVHLEIIYS